MEVNHTNPRTADLHETSQFYHFKYDKSDRKLHFLIKQIFKKIHRTGNQKLGLKFAVIEDFWYLKKCFLLKSKTKQHHAHFSIRLETKHYILQKSGLAYFVSVSKFKQLTSWQYQVIFRTVFLKVREVYFFEAMPMLRPIRSALGTNRVKYKDCATAISLNVSD
jgi:hypothetical protein